MCDSVTVRIVHVVASQRCAMYDSVTVRIVRVVASQRVYTRMKGKRRGGGKQIHKAERQNGRNRQKRGSARAAQTIREMW